MSGVDDKLTKTQTRPVIKTVYVWQNGMVMVFDENGEQVPFLGGLRLQGPLADVRENVARYLPESEWQHGIWNVTHRLGTRGVTNGAE